MPTRKARVPGRKGRPWTKTLSRPTQDTQTYSPERAEAARHAALKASATGEHDAAALVEVVRDAALRGAPPPQWAADALESFVSSFLTFTKRGKKSEWNAWAKRYPRRLLDAFVSDHIEGGRMDGLTWAEAADEASDWFHGTPAAGGPDAMLAAYKRHKRNGLTRPLTHLERLVDSHHMLSVRPYRKDSWWSVNHDRLDPERREWTRRPRLLRTKRR